MTTATQPPRFSFLGGALCLDFANTVDWHSGPNPSDRLRTYERLLIWAEQGGAVDAATAARLHAEAARRPAEAGALLERSVGLREALFRIFASVAAGDRPDAGDIAILNGWVGPALSHLRLVPKPEGYELNWEAETLTFDRPLWPVVRSAIDLLTAPPGVIRMCEGPACGWFFVDVTRNRRRRWCSMDDCGNRAKARRFYQRKKKSQ